jgi:hypothetical protein
MLTFNAIILHSSVANSLAHPPLASVFNANIGREQLRTNIHRAGSGDINADQPVLCMGK